MAGIEVTGNETDGVVLWVSLPKAARGPRSEGFTEAEFDLLFKINPAKILGLPLPGAATP